jgi:hypothetical protein
MKTVVSALLSRSLIRKLSMIFWLIVGSKRDALMQTIRQNPSGLTRGEILDKMGLKGDKSGEMSISNALTALIKANQISRRDGKYTSA